ncbi:MAG TPA: DNA primase [Gaiellaceae bacterium]|nr:DNA primase [Gaiellaceae bacterium]
MARIKQDSVDAVKAAADMLDVVGGRTQLRKAGARYVGRCPFHEERTPSFSVNPVDRLFYCFGCGKGGDLISFVRETENLDFAGAVEWLAERFRVPIEYEETSPAADAARKRRERLYALLEQATAFYERYLWETEAGAPVREYLAGRGLGEDVCKEFRLGLSPVAPALARKAAEKGFTRAELAAAGLANRRGNDYFSGRLMFPLADARGRVVGYSARKLRDDDPLQAKYVNSPEGELFHKSSVLYGLHLARQAIAKQERAIVVEGNPDAIALRQAGLEPVVASMGTALTERQLAELKRLTRRVYLCFDADAAGQAATLRGMDLAAAQGFEVKVVPLPPGLDPADAADSFAEFLGRAESYVFYRVRIELERAPDRQEAFVRVREVLAGFEDSPERQDAMRLVADRLDLPPEVQAGLAPTAAATKTGAVSSKVLEAGERLERDALAGSIAHPELVPLLIDLSPDHFDSDLHRALQAHLAEPAEPSRELLALLAELDARAGQAEIDAATAKELLLRLHIRHLRRQLAEDPERADLIEALERAREAVGTLV